MTRRLNVDAGAMSTRLRGTAVQLGRTVSVIGGSQWAVSDRWYPTSDGENLAFVYALPVKEFFGHSIFVRRIRLGRGAGA